MWSLNVGGYIIYPHISIRHMAEVIVHTMSNEQRELRQKLIQLGTNENTASVLLCLHHHGALTSKDLQCHCNIRQPDVSMAISELREMNLVHYAPRPESARGRPAHIYRLRMNLEQSIQPFVNRAKKRAKDIINNVSSINELVGKVQPNIDRQFTAG